MIDGVEVLIAWLSALGETRAERPSGAVLPYRWVNRIGGGSDRHSDNGVYSVHTFAAGPSEAQAEAMLTHRRLLALAGQFTGQAKVILGDGTVVQADDVDVVES